MLALRGVRRVFGGFVAVDDLDLEVPAGHCAVLLGQNGSGKTTTLALAAGELRPSSGLVTVGGHDVHRDDPWVRAQVAYAPDRPAFYPDLTVADHLQLVALAHGVGDAADELVDGLLTDWRLQDRRDARPDQLSSGMRQKLQLTCCLARPLSVLLLDEPARALDPGARRVLWRWLSALRDRGAVVLLSAHDLDFPSGLIDRALVLHGGRLVAEGPLDEVVRDAAIHELGLDS